MENNIILIGFMGAGKSSVAKHLSELLGFSWIEMDALVCEKTRSKTMHEVFEKGGELLFRETEIALGKEYALKKRQVISTGGGIVLNKISLDYMKAAGAKVVFLRTSFEVIVERLKGDVTRPLAPTKAMYDFRLPLYLQYAEQTIDTDHASPKQLAALIKTQCL